MKDYKKKENYKEGENDKIYSRRIRAGKRTYFFDVKATNSKDYYVTITERKKRAVGNDEYSYEKHKIFLYKEDFNKFVEALDDTVGHVKKELMPEYDFTQFDRKEERANLE